MTNSDMHNRKPQELADLVSSFELPKGDEIDLDERGRAYAREAIMRTRRTYWHNNTPSEYRHPESTTHAPRHNFDIEHPRIQTNRAQLEAIINWQYGRKGIIASGKTNRGKTRAMFALCHRLLCKEGVDVGIWPAQKFFAELQAQVRYGSDEAEEFIKRQALRPVLLIEDYGQHAALQSRQEWAQAWFFKLIDDRMSNGLSLLMTTNLSAKHIAEDGLGSEALVRRLLDIATPLRFV